MIVCTPPGSDGAPSAVVLAAAALAGVDRVFAVGGAGAIAAMAYGTTSIPRVDRIVGPGNAYVAEAKLQVSRTVGIDSPAGPSELVVRRRRCGHARGAGERAAGAGRARPGCRGRAADGQCVTRGRGRRGARRAPCGRTARGDHPRGAGGPRRTAHHAHARGGARLRE